MPRTAKAARARSLDEVVQLVHNKCGLEQREMLEAFVVRSFGQVDPEDLAERRAFDLYGAALSHWNFARTRAPGAPA
jgi:glutamate dehydrogenase